MSANPINTNSGVATTIADTDLVCAVSSGGGWKPISFANLMKAVRDGIQVGGRNLLRNSNIAKTTGTAYQYTKKPSIGKVYTLTACYTPAPGTARVTFGLNGGSFYDTVVCLNPTVGEESIVSGTVAITHNCENLYVYGHGSDVTCHWAVLTEGNMSAAGWFPAPEDLSDSWGG